MSDPADPIRVGGYDTFGSIMGGGEEEVLEALPGKLAALSVDGVLTGIGC